MRYEMRRIVALRNVARAMPGVSAPALARCKCVRTALCLLATISACGASAAELRRDADRDNPRAKDAALDRFTHGRALVPLELPVLASDPPPDPATAFAESACASGDSCGCEVDAEHHVWREGDRVVIARMVPDVEVHRVKRAGSCSMGCGVPMPPAPITYLSLAGIDRSKLEIDDVHYPYDQVVETCDHPVPAP
jgi:hypothetical protein